jgi:hypothetical protein
MELTFLFLAVDLIFILKRSWSLTLVYLDTNKIKTGELWITSNQARTQNILLHLSRISSPLFKLVTKTYAPSNSQPLLRRVFHYATDIIYNRAS